LTSADLLAPFQFEFRSGHSAETVILQVLSDILFTVVTVGDVAALFLSDLSAAFDYFILLQRLQKSFGIEELAFDWFRSYLSDRTQYVRRGSVKSSAVDLAYGIHQGSVLGPILFL
jgi:hypothetical protein